MKARPASLKLVRLPHINWALLLATLMLVAAVLAVAVDIALWAGQRFRPPPVSFIQGQSVFVAEMFYAVAYAGMGWLLATRVSRNPLGWIFLVLGASMSTQLSITFIVQQGHEAFRQLDPAVHLAAWFASSVHLPSVVLLNVLVFLLFPTGRPLSARWALAGWIAGAGTLLVILGVGLSPEGIAWYPSLANPLAAPMAMRLPLAATTIAGLALMVLGVVIATASMIARYRRATADQRAQLRWIAVAVIALSITGLPFIVVRYGLQADYASGHLLLATALIAGCFLPVAAAVAVLRHRLYDIDVILNRALVYLPLTALVGGMYTGGVAFTQRVFVAITGDTSDAAIVITTLVVASLFTQVRNSLQGFVDHRFKPAGSPHAAHHDALTIEQRVAMLEERIGQIDSDAEAKGAHRH
jgi:hypothetical protein